MTACCFRSSATSRSNTWCSASLAVSTRLAAVAAISLPSVKMMSAAISDWSEVRYSRTRWSMLPNSFALALASSIAVRLLAVATLDSASSAAPSASLLAVTLPIQNAWPCPAAT